MKADKKFGTFGGVFTPSVLTILGVIMYLRLPWVVGEAGLYLAVGIILVAHLISVSTGLSVSSISTDKKVKAGGAYFIISRSMGLSMGGTLGLALFAGLSFSVSLYIIGFTESVLDYFELAKDISTIRIWGTVTLIGLTTITFISTSLAIKTQYLILVTIAVSLLSIFMGSWDVPPETPHLTPFEGGNPATLLFGIFFPAVTGFTAGVNMSGDLRDPKKSIPLGTIAAIMAGLAIYLGLAIFLALKVPAEALREPGVLLKLAWSSKAVVAGIWGATLSSALGSILGAPRILQALSLDKVTPAIFGVGTGPTKEPRFALLVAVVIAEAGILIGELDAIARIVSVFFLATYGFLNLSASFEMIASPDFRPQFKIPRWVPVLGVISCLTLMIWLDLAAMLGAVAVMAMVFAVLKRRELALDTGDAWLGVWLKLVRSGLDRLARKTAHRRNWVPNLLVFTQRDAKTREPMLNFSYALLGQRGVVSELALVPAGDSKATVTKPAKPDADVSNAAVALESRSGFFSQTVDVPKGHLYGVLSAASRFHGVNGLRHNTIMVDWHAHASDAGSFANYLDLVEKLDLNIMCLINVDQLSLSSGREVHLWWSPRAGSIDLNIALARFLNESQGWQLAQLQFFLIADDASMIDVLYKGANKSIEDARINAKVTVVNNTIDQLSDNALVQRHSSKADLTVVGVSPGPLCIDDITRMDELCGSIGPAMLVRASSQFKTDAIAQILTASALRDVSSDYALPQQTILILPTCPALADEAVRFSSVHQQAMLATKESLLQPGFNLRTRVIDNIYALLERHYLRFEKTAALQKGLRRTKIVTETINTLLRDINEQLDDYLRSGLISQQASAERGIERLVEDMKALQACPRAIPVIRPIEDFKKQTDDSPRLGRLKWRCRMGKRLRPKAPSYRIDPRKLAAYYSQKRTMEIVEGAFQRSSREAVLLFNDLRKFFTMLKGSIAVIQRNHQKDNLSSSAIATERQQLLDYVERLRTGYLASAEKQVARLLVDATAIQQEYATDLDRLDFEWYAQRHRRLRRPDKQLPSQLGLLPARWTANEELLLGSVVFSVQAALVQMQLAADIQNVTESLQRGIAGGVRSSCVTLLADLQKLAARIDHADLTDMQIAAPAQGRYVEIASLCETLHGSLLAAVSQVAETYTLPSTQSLEQVVNDPFTEMEAQSIGVRLRLQILIDTKLSSPVTELLHELPIAERTATILMEDVVRLVGFTLSEFTQTEAAGKTEFESMFRPVIEQGEQRVEKEIERLDGVKDSILSRIQERLDGVTEMLDGFAIRGSAEGLLAQDHRMTERRATRLDRAVERMRQRIARLIVQLSYRESSGLLLARRLQETRTRVDLVDRVRGLVEALVPREPVMEQLPFYYRQLFQRQSVSHTAFWHGRNRELLEIERATQRFASGLSGPIVVTGEPGSGKSALINAAIGSFHAQNTVFRIRPPAGAPPTLDVFTASLREAFQLSGTCAEMFDAIPNRSVIVLSDLELWWERSDDGLAVIDQLLGLIAAHGNRCLFYLEVGIDLLRFLDHFRPIENDALVVTECGPVDAEALQHIISMRHSSSGLSYTREGHSASELSEYNKAKLFTSHFHCSKGNIGAALNSWMSNIAKVEDGRIEVRKPQVPDDRPLRSLPSSLLGVLVELILHRQLTPERLARITEEPLEMVTSDLARLRVMGLIAADRNDVFEILPAARYLVSQMLRDRRMLP